MKKKLFTMIMGIAVVALGASPALAAHVQAMDHHDHAIMDHAGMDHGAMGHANPSPAVSQPEDIQDRIPVFSSRGQGHHDHGQGEGKKVCAHHEVCPSDHICEMKDHQCHAVTGLRVYAVCSISAECGGGLPFQSVSIPSPNHELILTFFLYKEFRATSYFLPPLVEVALAGHPRELEHPPQSSSL